MREEDTRFRELKRRLVLLMEAVERNAASGHPSGGRSSTGVDLVLALRLWCHRLFRAITRLLDADLAAEAQLLFRTLLDDSALLVYLRHHEDELDDLAISWIYGSIQDERGLVLDFLSVETIPQHERDAAAKALGELEAYRDSMIQDQTDGRRLKPLPQGKDLHVWLGDVHAYGWYKIASGYVHTTRRALSEVVAEADDEEESRRDLYMTSELTQVLRVGLYSTALFIKANVAAAELMGWDTLDAVRTFSRQAETEIMELLGETLPEDVKVVEEAPDDSEG